MVDIMSGVEGKNMKMYEVLLSNMDTWRTLAEDEDEAAALAYLNLRLDDDEDTSRIVSVSLL